MSAYHRWYDYGFRDCPVPDLFPKPEFMPPLLATAQGDVLAGPDGVALGIF